MHLLVLHEIAGRSSPFRSCIFLTVRWRRLVVVIVLLLKALHAVLVLEAPDAVPLLGDDRYGLATVVAKNH